MLPFKAIVSAGSGELLRNHPRGRRYWSCQPIRLSRKIHLTMIHRKVKLYSSIEGIVIEYLNICVCTIILESPFATFVCTFVGCSMPCIEAIRHYTLYRTIHGHSTHHSSLITYHLHHILVYTSLPTRMSWFARLTAASFLTTHSVVQWTSADSADRLISAVRATMISS